tara:strand:+ start:682 stop:1728 length:1047 start_codon:yes stop_codon:yes gene_type:complete
MAADVLTYNALQEVNQELKAESATLSAGITSAGGGGGAGDPSDDCRLMLSGAGAPNTLLWCMIPKTAAEGGSWTGGFSVCETSNYKRCNAECTWTVPAGTSCARFQVWGAGGGSASGCCCGGSPNGGSGAYASVIMPVTPGQSYTLCAGCAYCCYTERAQMTADGCPSYVTGQGLTNFCADGGESNIYCESRERRHKAQYEQNGFCAFRGSCLCNNGSDYCSQDQQSGGLGEPEDHYDMNDQATANHKGYYGDATGGKVWGIPGQWSYGRYACGSKQHCTWSPGIYGFPTSSCCCYCFSNENSGCCFQACYCAHQIPGAGAFGYSTCGGDTSGCADVGRMGMVCVSYL